MYDAHREVRRLTKVIGVFEIVLDVKTPPKFVQLIVSIPGHDGTKPYTWLLPESGVMDHGQYKDLVSVVERDLVNALTLDGGIQEVLPME